MRTVSLFLYIQVSLAPTHVRLGQRPKFTFSTFTPDPNLHKPRFTRDPYLQSPDLHKSIFAHRFQETQVYTTQIYTKLSLPILLKLYPVNSIINPG